MQDTIQKFGRWGKRSFLEMQMSLAPSSRKKFYNRKLNAREFWHGRTRLRSYPLFVQVGTNWTCNLHCPFCRREVEPYKEELKNLPPGRREISSIVLDKLVEILPYAIRFSLTPLGEPLMYSRLEYILEIHRKLGCRNLNMTTNGALLDKYRSELIVKSQVESINISLDTVHPDRYRSMRKGAELNQVLDGIKSLQEWKKKLDSPLPRLIFASTFMRSNIEDLPGLIELANELDVEAITVQLMDPENPEFEPEMLWHHIPVTLKVMEESFRLAKEKGVRLDTTIALRNLLSSAKETSPGMENKLLEMAPDLDTRGKSLVEKCRLPWESLLIDTDGEVRPCCWAGIRFGNLTSQSFQEVWNSVEAVKTRDLFLKNIIPGGCRNKHCRVEEIVR